MKCQKKKKKSQTKKNKKKANKTLPELKSFRTQSMSVSNNDSVR